MNTRSVRAREDAETRFKRKTEEVVLASRAAADYAAAHKAALANMERLKALRAARDAGATPVSPQEPAKRVRRAAP
ncbi:hypothetical protein PQJ75_00505 [Rhodoplanes sp. TEM]|uniref:Transcriptional regulator n=1 Tax=Rhodoplanes tepidamans TaxID=200616 RepID=A0ABT5J5L3_RHOTP|nr:MULTISPECIES: hypothetical protein [Rhodoplanes]MDC7784732.1 hypothetical protein [Rhodoplanes tepidamans]MDC7982199.1 hypothetical protein [Rhodoplanes sp. TEM]MDQ0356204.1 hypothetical protein [Rhodoplanes tepidamans]